MQNRTYVRLLIALVICIGFFSASSRADTIALGQIGSNQQITLNLVQLSTSPFTLLAEDVQGINAAAVYTPTNTYLGLELVGIDPGTYMFPNAQLFVQDVDPIMGQVVGIVLDYTTLAVNGTDATVFANGYPGGAITDPALAAFLGLLRFDFTLTSANVDPTSNLLVSNWTIAAITPVPEPASLMLMGSGLLMLGKRLRRKS
jgi:hypothetical protein